MAVENERLGRVRSFFGDHADYYVASVSQRSGSDLALLLDALRLKSEDRALDVATASGNVAFAMAARVHQVTGLDVTPEMGELFRGRLEAEPEANVHFALGDVHALPFPDGNFTVVTSRRAAHHFSDLPLALREMRRVLVPGGRLGIADMTVPDDSRAAELMNQLEILHWQTGGSAGGSAGWWSSAKSLQPDPRSVRNLGCREAVEEAVHALADLGLRRNPGLSRRWMVRCP